MDFGKPRGGGHFQTEVIKLLVHAAWSDGRVAETERRAIEEAVRAADLDAATRGRIEAALDGAAPPPIPNFGVLRERRDEALAAVRAVVLADGHSAPDEMTLLGLFEELLDG